MILKVSTFISLGFGPVSLTDLLGVLGWVPMTFERVLQQDLELKGFGSRFRLNLKEAFVTVLHYTCARFAGLSAQYDGLLQDSGFRVLGRRATSNPNRFEIPRPISASNTLTTPSKPQHVPNRSKCKDSISR